MISLVLALAVGLTPMQLSPWIQDTSEGYLNTATHVYQTWAQWNPLCAMVTGANMRVLIRSYGADTLADQFRRELPAAWVTATRGLGKIVVVAEGTPSDLEVHVMPGAGRDYGYRCYDQLVPGARAVVLYERIACPYSACVEIPQTMAILHEMGHFWCCYGAFATVDHHWIGPTSADIMTNPGPTTVHPFSNRELQVMRLGV